MRRPLLRLIIIFLLAFLASTTFADAPQECSPLYIFTGVSYDELGCAASGAGDVNNDGYADIIVGAWGNDHSGSNAGRAYVYSGNDGSQLYVLNGERGGDVYGHDVCGETDADTVCITVTSGDVAQIECPTEPLSDRLCDPAEICFPLIITPATAEVSVSYGAFADNEICFYADTAGSYEITVIASEVCGSDTCTITVNIYFDEYVSITCPDLPVTASLCEPDTIPILLPITPSSASLSILPFGTYDFASSKLSFFADTSGHYEITVIAESPCNVDTCVVEANVTIMDAPQVTCPDDIDTLICLPEVSEICFCVEVIGTGVEVTVLPEGSYSGGMVCVPVSEAGTFMITVIASSVCGADTCEVELTIIENQTPVLTVPEDTMIAWCDDYTGHVCISGIFAVDPEDDPVTITKTCGPGTFIPARDDSGEICFEPDNIDTTYEFCFEATDGCTTDLKSFFVTMYPSPICSVCVDIAIETDSCVIVGAKVPVKLVINTYDPIGGLDLLIGYDATAMSFLEVYKGDAIDGWEYFTYRLNDEDDCGTACPSGLLRIVGIADVNDGAHHPPSEQLTPSGILGWIMMRVANNQNLGGLYLPINFYWQDCGDNTFSNPAGDLLYIDLRIFDPFDNVIWDETDDILYPEESRPPGLGAGDSCMIGDKVTPLRCVYFHNGGICVKHPDSTVTEGFGTVAGSVSVFCDGGSEILLNAAVDAYDEVGDLIGSTHTLPDGFYEITGLPSGASYTISIIAPLGFSANEDEQPIDISCGETSIVDFSLSCVEITASPRTIGFWKHQVGVALGGRGRAQIDAATLCDYLDLIENHFNSNEINQVIVYEPPASGLCGDKLLVAKDLLNLKGNAGMTARAKQQLTALLLNVAAGYISQTTIISVDSATLSQAITYCDNLIDDPNGDHELAKTIADEINNGRQIAAGIIPLAIANVAYKEVPALYSLSQNYPNPFNPITEITFSLPSATNVKLEIFNIVGQKVATLIDGRLEAGIHSYIWDGSKFVSGVYFYRIKAGEFIESRKMILLK